MVGSRFELGYCLAYNLVVGTEKDQRSSFLVVLVVLASYG